MRLSELASDRSRVDTFLLSSLKAGDAITQVLGVFSDFAGGMQAFFRTRFELFLWDQGSGKTWFGDLKQYDSVTRHLMARVGGQPAVFLPEGQGSSLTTEVLLPPRAGSDSSDAGELFRPAAYKTLGVGGCELINMISTSANGAGSGLNDLPESLTYFCGDHFIEMKL